MESATRPAQAVGAQEAQAEAAPTRVVSLLGAATETLYRLGLGSKLVGRSHECDFPPQCLALPCVSRPRLDVDAPSKEIDMVVRGHSAAGESSYLLDPDQMATLGPDLIITQDQCRVCAVTPADVESSGKCANVRQLVLKPVTLADCIDAVSTIADVMGVHGRGVALRHTLESRMERIAELVAGVAPRARPRVALLEWCEPIMGCGYWIPELVSLAGGEALHCPPPGGATPTISFDALVASAPDIVVFALCGFGVTRSATEIQNAWGAAQIATLSRICHDRVFVVDGNYLVNRSGPRVVESAEALAEVIHPALLGHFGHFGTELLATLSGALVLAGSGASTGRATIPPVPVSEVTPASAAFFDAVGADAVDGASAPLPTLGPDAAVAAQLACMRADDMLRAFALNSAANQARWCAPERFEAVLKSHGDFKRLLTEPATVGAVAVTGGGRLATVVVSLPVTAEASAVALLWTMVAEVPEVGAPVVWRTEKVGSG